MPGETKGTRVIALVGPAGAGKTSLAEALLFASGTTDRQGSVANGSSIGDSQRGSARSAADRPKPTSTISLISATNTRSSTPPARSASRPTPTRGVAVADVAIVVVDPDPARAALAAPALRMLDELGIPHLIFVNRIDQAHGRIRDLLTALQPMSVSPLIARQIPIRDGEKVTGFVDVALERAYHYVPGKPSEPIALPEELAEREAQARTQLLEQLADHDDTLLEQLLMDQVPEPGTIFADLAPRDQRQSRRLRCCSARPRTAGASAACSRRCATKRPGPDATAARLGVDAPALYAFKIYAWRLGRAGWRWPARSADRSTRSSDFKSSSGEHGRLGALFAVQGDKTGKIAEAGDGDVVAVAKADGVKAGDWLGSGKLPSPIEIDPALAQLRASRSNPPTARTTSGCRARSRGSSRKIPA